MWKWRASSDWMLCALIFVIVAFVFQTARHGAFLLWDDNINIATNPHLRELSWENVRWMFTDSSYMRRYVPLAWLGWNIDQQLFGLTPQSAHVGNVMFHALNATLVFLLLKKALTAWRGETSAAEGTVIVAAGSGALLWAIHPMRAEVVGWASGRMYCQAGFFLLLAALAYFAAVQSPSHRGRCAWIGVATAAFGASLLTYPIGLTFVAVLVIIDVFVLRRFPAGIGWFDRRVRGVWWEKIPFVLMAAVVGTATLAARFTARGLWEAPPTLAEFGIGARIMQACYVWVYYVWKPLFPSGLSPVYTTLLGFNPSAPLFVFSFIAVVALTVLLIRQRRHWPAALALWLSHMCLLAPMTGFTERAHYVNDRYGYLQGVLLAVGVAALLRRALMMRYQRWAIAVAVVVIGSFVVSSIAQLRIWRDSEALFAHVYHSTSYTPTRADIAFRLGDALRIKGRTAEATQYYRESLRLVPTGERAAVPHFGLGIIAQTENRAQDAVDHFQAAIRLEPEFAEAHLALGGMLVQAGRLADALPFLKRAAALQPSNADAREILGVALFQTGGYGASVEEFAAASRLRPESVPLLCNLASALIAAGRIPEALACSQRATRLNPASAEAFMSLGDALRLSGRGSEAIDALREAVRRKPMLPAAHNLLGTALATSGRVAEALAAFREATRLDPGFVLAQFNLGLALRDSGNREEAIKAFSAALRLQPDYAAARDELARLQAR